MALLHKNGSVEIFKDSIKYHKHFQDSINVSDVKQCYTQVSKDIQDHICGNYIISSFDSNGKITKYHDAANILAYCHIEYDEDILKIVPLEYVTETCSKLVDSFRQKYNHDELHLIGRYPNDTYYNGHVWVLCSLALGQIYIELYKRKNIVTYSSPMHRSKSNPNNNYIEIADCILERILTLDPNLILPEQFNPINSEYYSARKLTWNYSELYQLYNLLK